MKEYVRPWVTVVGPQNSIRLIRPFFRGHERFGDSHEAVGGKVLSGATIGSPRH